MQYPPLLVRGGKLEWQYAIIRGIIEELRRKRGVLVINNDIATVMELAKILE